MYNFKNDYTVGAHPKILQKLIETNLTPQLGYGDDDYSSQAREILKQKIRNSKAKVFFLSGGTQVNLITISFLLKGYEAVISAKTAHISANETGAIEATGHKVITVETRDGKLRPIDIELTLKEYTLQPHVVKPRMVFISNSTEMGTHYTKTELVELYGFCKKRNLLLYLDGARLGHGLVAENNDLSLSDLANLTDVFYIGATKNGALLGEALVFNSQKMAEEFEFVLKQKGAMLAKSRILAIQFLVLFEDDLYFKLAEHANKMAKKIADAFEQKGYSLLTQSATNQIFPILPSNIISKLSEKYMFYIWKKINEKESAIRLITSWATKECIVDELVNDVENLNVGKNKVAPSN